MSHPCVGAPVSVGASLSDPLIGDCVVLKCILQQQQQQPILSPSGLTTLPGQVTGLFIAFVP